jgi:hypothetical protein
LSNSKDNKSTTTLFGILRLKINQAHGNKFWLVDQWKDICVNQDANNELLSYEGIVKGIKNGKVETEKRIKNYEILVNESEFFRIVEYIHPACVVDDGRGYKWIKDIVEIKVGRNYKHYDTWFSKEAVEKNELGIIYVNGKRFKKIFCSASHVRQKKVFFVAKELYDQVMEIALAGIKIDNPDNIKEPCKWGAYLGMCCTDSKAVTMPNVVIIRDPHQEITEKFDVVKGTVIDNPDKDKKGIDYLYQLDTKPENNTNKTIKIDFADGAGLVDISLAQKWAKELKLDYIPSAWQFRAMAGVKGNVYTFDIKGFAKTYKAQTITDRWGKEYEIFDKKQELKINCILTESQVKFAKMFYSAKEWTDAFNQEAYGYSRTFNISDICIPYGKLKNKCILSYQPLQTLELTDDEIKTLCTDTIDKVTKVHTDIDAFVKWRGLDKDDGEKSEKEKYTNPALLSLKYDHSLANDSYVHKVMMDNLLKFRMANHIRLSVQGNYQVFIPDIFALAQAAFQLPVTGLLKAGQIYNLFWHNQGATELTMIRFPHVAREHYLVNIANKNSDNWEAMQHWYKYQNVGYISSIHDSLALRLGGADYDDDHVYGLAEETICNAVRRNPANTIWFERDKDGEVKANKKVQFSDYGAIAHSDSVGMRNEIGDVINQTSQLWSMITPKNTAEENNRIYDYIKILSVIDSLCIDFAKTGIKAQMPQDIESVLKGYKNPYFMQFKDKQKTGKNKQVQKRALQNNTKATVKYSDSQSTMNRIAHFMDDNISNLKGDYNAPKFEWTTLLQGEADQQDSITYKAVVKKLKELHHAYSKQCQNLNASGNRDTDDDGKDNSKVAMMRLRLIFAECKVQLLLVQPDINKLLNDVIIAYYTEKELVSQSKAIIWNCFQNQMITRCKGRKSKEKIYNIDDLQKQHDKIVKAHKKETTYKNKQIGIAAVDQIKNKVSITDADKKYINKVLNTQRSKKLYYALLYVWLKWKKANPKADNMEIMYHSADQISKSQLCKIAGVQTKAWRDIITSLQNTELVEIISVDEKSTKIYLNYQCIKGVKIELPETCNKMRHWINRYVPVDKHRHEEAENYSISDFTKAKQSLKKAVMCVETGEIFESIKDVERKTTFDKNAISACCRGKQKTSGGYHWQFVK